MLNPHILLGLSFKDSAAPRLTGAAGPQDQVIPVCSLQWNLEAASLHWAQSLLSSGNICSHRYNTSYMRKTQNLNVPKYRALFFLTLQLLSEVVPPLGLPSAIIAWKSLRTIIPCCSSSSASPWLIKCVSMKGTCTSAWSHLFLS